MPMNEHEKVLAVELDRNDAGVKTVAQYLLLLASEVYRLDEEFHGKRPFGNSSWWREIEVPVAREFKLEEPEDAREKIQAAINYWIERF